MYEGHLISFRPIIEGAPVCSKYCANWINNLVVSLDTKNHNSVLYILVFTTSSVSEDSVSKTNQCKIDYFSIEMRLSLD